MTRRYALALFLVTSLILPWRAAFAEAAPAPLSNLHFQAAATNPAFLYTCLWKGQAVTLTRVRQKKVNKLPGAKPAGICAGPSFVSSGNTNRSLSSLWSELSGTVASCPFSPAIVTFFCCCASASARLIGRARKL